MLAGSKSSSPAKYTYNKFKSYFSLRQTTIKEILPSHFYQYGAFFWKCKRKNNNRKISDSCTTYKTIKKTLGVLQCKSKVLSVYNSPQFPFYRLIICLSLQFLFKLLKTKQQMKKNLLKHLTDHHTLLTHSLIPIPYYLLPNPYSLITTP